MTAIQLTVTHWCTSFLNQASPSNPFLCSSSRWLPNPILSFIGQNPRQRHSFKRLTIPSASNLQTCLISARLPRSSLKSLCVRVRRCPSLNARTLAARGACIVDHIKLKMPNMYPNLPNFLYRPRRRWSCSQEGALWSTMAFLVCSQFFWLLLIGSLALINDNVFKDSIAVDTVEDAVENWVLLLVWQQHHTAFWNLSGRSLYFTGHY